MSARKLFLTHLVTQLTSWIDRAGKLYLMTAIGDRFYKHFPKEEHPISIHPLINSKLKLGLPAKNVLIFDTALGKHGMTAR